MSCGRKKKRVCEINNHHLCFGRATKDGKRHNHNIFISQTSFVIFLVKQAKKIIRQLQRPGGWGQISAE